MQKIFLGTKLCAASILGYAMTRYALPVFMPKLLKAGLGGIDLNKPRDEKTQKTPEAGGLIVVTVTAMMIGLFGQQASLFFPALCSGLLGFADNVLNLEWRWKLIVPACTLVPLCQWYARTYTFELFGWKIPSILTGIAIILYSIFCQNAVNIYAGINGIEVGQSIVAQSALVVYMFMKYSPSTVFDNGNLFSSLTISCLFIVASLGLLHFNKFPAKVFVGDVYTYFAGCVYVTAAVTSNCLIASGFLYFMQLINFILSIPQLVGWVPCPRHRLPGLKEDGLLYGKTENWNLINQYLLRIIRGGLSEHSIWRHLITIQAIGSIAILGAIVFLNRSAAK